jgi:hypothetical protein
MMRDVPPKKLVKLKRRMVRRRNVKVPAKSLMEKILYSESEVSDENQDKGKEDEEKKY